MKKIIILYFILICMMVSCGKKGDPEYKVSKKKIEIQTILVNKI